jgi:hypothetical protein
MSTSPSTTRTKIPNTNYFQKRSSLLRCFGQFSVMLYVFMKIYLLFWQNKVVLTYVLWAPLLSSPILTPGKHIVSVHSKWSVLCHIVRCRDGETLEITNIVQERNHEVSKAAFNHLFHQRRLDSGQKNEIESVWNLSPTKGYCNTTYTRLQGRLWY